MVGLDARSGFDGVGQPDLAELRCGSWMLDQDRSVWSGEYEATFRSKSLQHATSSIPVADGNQHDANGDVIRIRFPSALLHQPRELHRHNERRLAARSPIRLLLLEYAKFLFLWVQ